MKKDKKSMIMVIVIGVTLCLFLCFNTTVFATTGTVTTSDLRLRKENSTTSQILDLLNENQEVEIISEDGDWYKVKAGNKVGYVSKQYIKVKENNNVVENDTTPENTKSEENTKDEEAKNENNEENTNQAIVTQKEATIKEETSIRIMPLVNGDVINTAKANQNITIVSNVGLWSYVKNDSVSGWILTQNLEIKDAVQNNETEEVKQEENSDSQENAEENNQQNDEQNTAEDNSNENEEVIEENPETMYSSAKTYYVSGTSVNVRSQASKSSNVVKVLSVNAEVSVTGESGEWYIVNINGTKAYIAKSLLSTTKKEVTSRSSNSVTTQQEPVQEEATETVVEETPAAAPSTGSSTGSAVASYAQQFVGYPYVYGASGPNSFDCSGFAQYVYKQFGYYLNRTAADQSANGYYVSKSELQPGDLVFFNTSGGGISHVGIYIGGDQFVHASTSKTGVIISSLSQSYYVQRYVTARRIA